MGKKGLFDNRKGFSGIIIMIVILLLVVSALAITWAVLSRKVFTEFKRGTPQYIACLEIEVVLEGCVRNVSGGISYVKVKRNSGGGDVSGINVQFTNGSNYAVFDAPPIEKLESRIYSYNINYTNLSAYLVPLVGEEKIPCRATVSSYCLEFS